MRVEIGEDFRSEIVDQRSDFIRECDSALAEFKEGVGGGGVDSEDQWTERFDNVHRDLSKAESSEGDCWEQNPSTNCDADGGDAIGHKAEDVVFIIEVAKENDVEVIQKRRERKRDEEFPSGHYVPCRDFNGGALKSFFSLFDGDDFGCDEDRKEEEEARESAETD